MGLLDPQKKYKVAVYQFLLGGMNEIEPLLTYVRNNVTVPDLELCLPAKGLVMETCMKKMWKKISGKSTDLKNSFAAMDPNGDGSISQEELVTYLMNLRGKENPEDDVSVDLVSQMV